MPEIIVRDGAVGEIFASCMVHPIEARRHLIFGSEMREIAEAGGCDVTFGLKRENSVQNHDPDVASRANSL